MTAESIPNLEADRETLGVSFLGELPRDPRTRRAGDAGERVAALPAAAREAA